jgi:hypothetical protein
VCESDVGSWLEGERKVGDGGTEWGEVKQHQSSRPAPALRSDWLMREQSEGTISKHTLRGV